MTFEHSFSAEREEYFFLNRLEHAIGMKSISSTDLQKQKEIPKKEHKYNMTLLRRGKRKRRSISCQELNKSE